MVSTSPYHCLTLSLLLLPPLLFTTYFLSAFPKPPEQLFLHPSLASLPPDARSWSIYPEDFYSGGAYAEFPSGRVRYWLLGPETGKKIVLIHGLSIPAIVWKDVAPALASNGYRVLLYDLYGRGYSDAPDTIYNTSLYTTQLALLMQYLNWSRANIVGVSMGGAIAATFTAQFPHLVDEGVALIACAGLMESNDISRTAKFMSSPLVRTLASSRPVRAYLQHLTNQTVTNSKGGVDDDSAILEIVRLQSAHLPGYNHALSSSLRDGPIRGQAKAFMADGWSGKRVLIVHGTKDRTVPPKYAGRIEGMIRGEGGEGGEEKQMYGNKGRGEREERHQHVLSTTTRSETTSREKDDKGGRGVKTRKVMIQGGGHDLTISHPEDVVRMVGELVDGRGRWV
ncbi:Alpha/Beta hydrolase protein [Panaeolus papilionaceus]|nr:Alpha/Beta hydrolase protein [Panaeolus papilionaceus]